MKIRSESGRGKRASEGVGARGVGPAGGGPCGEREREGLANFVVSLRGAFWLFSAYLSGPTLWPVLRFFLLQIKSF